MVGQDQYGVGVPAGCESVAMAVSHLAAAIRPDDTDTVIFRSDFVNAFNSMSRAIILNEVYRVFPEMAPFAYAAYGEHSVLKFGKSFLSSQQGVQQGDPFGPLFFALGLAKMWREIRATVGESTVKALFAAWIMDDGVFVGPLSAVSAIIDAMLAIGPSFGLQLNLAKCELIGWGIPQDFWPEILSRRKPDDFVHLGVCCGSADAREKFATDLVNKMKRQQGAYACVAKKDPLAAFTLMRMCSHRASLNYFVRTMGPLNAWLEADSCSRDWFCDSIVALPDEKAELQLQLPLRQGGFGLPLLEQIAPLAHFACILATRDLFETHVQLSAAAELVVSPALAPFKLVTSEMRRLCSQGIDTQSTSSWRVLEHAYSGPYSEDDHLTKHDTAQATGNVYVRCDEQESASAVATTQLVGSQALSASLPPTKEVEQVSASAVTTTQLVGSQALPALLPTSSCVTEEVADDDCALSSVSALYCATRETEELTHPLFSNRAPLDDSGCEQSPCIYASTQQQPNLSRPAGSQQSTVELFFGPTQHTDGSQQQQSSSQGISKSALMEQATSAPSSRCCQVEAAGSDVAVVCDPVVVSSLSICEDVERPQSGGDQAVNTQASAGPSRGDGPKIQRELTMLLQGILTDNLMASCLNMRDKARLMSLRAKTTCLWLCPTRATSREGIWMRNADEFRTACRLRLGLRVTDKEEPCIKCQAKETTTANQRRDCFGDHTLCCMVGGDRCRLHNAVCRQLQRDAAFGLLHPGGETHPFGDGHRLDFTFVLPRAGTEQLVDVALTFPMRKDFAAYAANRPGGAATGYEKVKTRMYGHKLGPRQRLVPMIFDTFGGAGDSGVKLLRTIALAYQQRFGSRSGRVIFYARLNTLIVSKVAAIVLAGA